MSNENKEFISDLDRYNFDILINKGFSLDEIEELKKIIKIIYQNIELKIYRKYKIKILDLRSIYKNCRFLYF